MAQLVGSICVFCRQRIGSVLDGRFCDICNNPMHTSCIQPQMNRSVEGRCPGCGMDMPAAQIRDQERKTRKQTTSIPGNYPVSTVCPKCGSSEYSKRRSEKWIAFTSDRVCKACGTRYIPPTPVWAAVVFILAGLLLGGFGAISIFFHFMATNPLGIPAMACEGFLGIVGVLAIIHGIRSLLKWRKV